MVRSLVQCRKMDVFGTLSLMVLVERKLLKDTRLISARAVRDDC